MQFLSNRSQLVRYLWWTVVGVNTLTSCQECPRAVFWACCCYCIFFHSGLNKLIGYADDFTLIVVGPSLGVKVIVAESMSHNLVRLVSGVTSGG